MRTIRCGVRCAYWKRTRAFEVDIEDEFVSFAGFTGQLAAARSAQCDLD